MGPTEIANPTVWASHGFARMSQECHPRHVWCLARRWAFILHFEGCGIWSLDLPANCFDMGTEGRHSDYVEISDYAEIRTPTGVWGGGELHIYTP